jgi:pSer/pThr/pTyr-binding forkhead associated (FHA) protein
MPEQSVPVPQMRAWLVSYSGATPGIKYELGDGATCVGRGPQNDLVIQGPDVASVSIQHLEIRREAAGFRLRDLDSTNGTYLNGERITEVDLCATATIRFGSQGPELTFTTAEPAAAELDKTMAIPEGIQQPPALEPAAPSGTYEGLLSAAVKRARHARLKGWGDQTLTIMRETLQLALRHTSRRLNWTIGILAAGLIGVAGGAAWKIAALDREKHSIDQRIHQVEMQLQQTSGKPTESDRLISELADYQGRAQQLERNPLYRFGPHDKEDFLIQEIRTLMAEFGAEVYSVPPEFAERAGHYIELYQGPDRPLVAQALNGSAGQLKIMRLILQEEQLPVDLVYIPLVESALASDKASPAGALGPWQLTPVTARAFGLRVDKQVDERTNLAKSTRASCRFLRELILDFGAGSSVMLALAAYNLGPSKVKQAVMNTVRDPIKQRDFWYLYRVNALPRETREYVPKVVAAMIVGRNPRHFGF